MTGEATENRQLGGYKATLHNPGATRQAKLHAAETLEAHGISSAPDIEINPSPSPHKHDTPSKPHEYHEAHVHKHAHGVKTEKGRTEGMTTRSMSRVVDPVKEEGKGTKKEKTEKR